MCRIYRAFTCQTDYLKIIQKIIGIDNLDNYYKKEKNKDLKS